MYIIDPNSKIPLYIQLYNELKQDIITNKTINEKLPSIRKIASTYNLSKNTVQSAYNQLYAEGYIDSYEKSGYFVLHNNYDNTSITTKQPTITHKPQIQYKYDFYPAGLPKDIFPLKLWKRLTTKALDETLNFGIYLDGQGELDLREQIAKYLVESRGVEANPSNIIISNGFAESMELVAKLLTKTYNTLLIEKPGYYIPKEIFNDYNYNTQDISINRSGINKKELNKYNNTILYITPSHQYPTGTSIPINNRFEILQWATKNNNIIIEDDYDSELNYINRPIPALQGLTKNNNVIYFGTFAKSLSPTLRICYMVVPDFFIDLYKNSFHSHFPKVSLQIQKTMTLFLQNGYYERHLRKLRTLNRKKHNLLKEALDKYLKTTYKIESQGAGLSIVINPIVPFDIQKLKQLAIQNNIKLYFASNITNNAWEGLRMGFGTLQINQIDDAIKAFSNIWFKSIVDKNL